MPATDTWPCMKCGRRRGAGKYNKYQFYRDVMNMKCVDCVAEDTPADTSDHALWSAVFDEVKEDAAEFSSDVPSDPLQPQSQTQASAAAAPRDAMPPSAPIEFDFSGALPATSPAAEADACQPTQSVPLEVDFSFTTPMDAAEAAAPSDATPRSGGCKTIPKAAAESAVPTAVVSRLDTWPCMKCGRRRGAGKYNNYQYSQEVGNMKCVDCVAEDTPADTSDHALWSAVFDEVRDDAVEFSSDTPRSQEVVGSDMPLAATQGDSQEHAQPAAATPPIEFDFSGAVPATNTVWKMGSEVVDFSGRASAHASTASPEPSLPQPQTSLTFEWRMPTIVPEDVLEAHTDAPAEATPRLTDLEEARAYVMQQTGNMSSEPASTSPSAAPLATSNMQPLSVLFDVSTIMSPEEIQAMQENANAFASTFQSSEQDHPNASPSLIDFSSSVNASAGAAVMLSALLGADPTAHTTDELDATPGTQKPLAVMMADRFTAEVIQPVFDIPQEEFIEWWCALSLDGSEMLAVRLRSSTLLLQYYDTHTGKVLSSSTQEWSRPWDSFSLLFVRTTTPDSDSAIVAVTASCLMLLSRTGIVLDERWISGKGCRLLRLSDDTFVVASSEPEVWTAEQGKLVRRLVLQIDTPQPDGYFIGHGCAASHNSPHVVCLRGTTLHVWNTDTHLLHKIDASSFLESEKTGGSASFSRLFFIPPVACIGRHRAIVGNVRTLFFVDLLSGTCTASFEIEGDDDWGNLLQIEPISDRHVVARLHRRIVQVDILIRRVVRHFAPLDIIAAKCMFYQSGVLIDEHGRRVYRLPRESEHLQSLVDANALAHDVFAVPWLVITIMQYVSSALPVTARRH